MIPKISVRPMPRSAYVPPSTTPLSTCCRIWSTRARNQRIRNQGSEYQESTSRTTRYPIPDPRCLILRLRDLTLLQQDDVDVGNVLPAFLAFGTLLGEGDVAVHAVQLGLPQGLADRVGL